MLVSTLQFLAILIGCLAFYIAFFMYEDEQGKWQNRIEDLWVKIDDRKNSSGGRTSAFFGKVAAIVTRGFNRLFGQKLISFQFVGVSTCCSFATLVLLCFVTFVATQRGVFGPLPPDLSQVLPFLERFVLIAGIIFSLLAILPSIFRSWWAVALSMIPAVFFGAGFIIITKAHLWTPKRWSFLGGLLLGLLSDVLLLALVRFTVRVSAKTSVWRIAITLLMQAGIVYFLVLVPLAIPAVAAEEKLFEDFRQSTTLMTFAGIGGLTSSLDSHLPSFS